MTRETLSLLDPCYSLPRGSEERYEAVEAVCLSAMYRCDDDAVAYLWSAVTGMADLEFPRSTALGKRVVALSGHLAQYCRDAREANF